MSSCKIVPILLVIAAIPAAAAVILICYRHFSKNIVWDGDGSVYRWTEQELWGEWIDIGRASDPNPVYLTFDKDCFTLKSEAGEESFGYELPEGTEECGVPEGEIRFTLVHCGEFENLIFHEETLPDGETVPIISAVIFEHDGRGEIVIAEFVRRENLEKLPEGFRSQACSDRNDGTSVPTIKTT